MIDFVHQRVEKAAVSPDARKPGRRAGAPAVAEQTLEDCTDRFPSPRASALQEIVLPYAQA
jgi:hypothetical protein